MNDALARLRAELEAAAAKDKADALAAQEAKLTVRLRPGRCPPIHSALTRLSVAVLARMSPPPRAGRLPEGEGGFDCGL